MKLELIRLTNFRQFYGEQTIRFSVDPKKSITVINGVNGSGKTSIMTALRWCLYGLASETLGELMCKRALMETPIKSNVEAKVQLTFTHDGERFTATRTLEGARVSKEEWNRDGTSTLTLARVRSDGQFEAIPNATGRVESILPSAVSQYFFFDGEKIDEFAKPGHEAHIRSGVRNVLKIEVLERARTHLAAVSKEYQKELKINATGKLQALLEAQERTQERLETEKARLAELRAERIAAQNQLAQIDERLGQIQETRKWDAQRRQYTGILQAKEEQKQRLWREIRDLTNRTFISLGRPVLEKALSILDEKRERGEIPPGIREQFIEDLIGRKECICGHPINEGGKEHELLRRLLKKAVSSGLESAVIQTSGDLRAMSADTDAIFEAIRSKMSEKATLDKDMELLNQQLDEISRHLQGFDTEEVSSLEKKRVDCHSQIVLLAGDIGRIDERIERTKADSDTLKREVEKAEFSEKKAQTLKRRFSLATRSADAADKMCDTFATNMRQSIEQEAKKIFSKLIWKDSQFQDVQLSEDYHLEVYDRWGSPARKELSAGERQVLSLAFITGMSKVAGEEAPLVMDTPFGRLSSAHRENITKQIPALTSQLVLFVTDEELHSKARENLDSMIGSEYELRFDQRSGCTSIAQLN